MTTHPDVIPGSGAVVVHNPPARLEGYRRLNAPIFASPAGLSLFRRSRRVRPDLARIRVYSDDPAQIGERMKLEVFPRGADGASFDLIVRVAWVERFTGVAPARYELGFDVTWIAVKDEAALALLI
jgi:hypothetical protein